MSDGTILGEILEWSRGDYAGVRPSKHLSHHAMHELAKRLRAEREGYREFLGKALHFVEWARAYNNQHPHLITLAASLFDAIPYEVDRLRRELEDAHENMRRVLEERDQWKERSKKWKERALAAEPHRADLRREP